MKFLFVLVPLTAAFAPMKAPARTGVKLDMASRRDVLITGAAAFAGTAAPAFAKQAGVGPDWPFLDPYEVVPAQQATSGKLDVNSAFVGDYTQFRGMFPSAAGKIASNGPYGKVQDIYKIEGLSDHDIKMFKKYEKEV
mmetsp:Transcript_12419/g.36594  ORF Transcript_12419/g.36594 Transcript_12419/m.36594 type:complete len:138 (-) Transcript_12419:472-885(-)